MCFFLRLCFKGKRCYKILSSLFEDLHPFISLIMGECDHWTHPRSVVLVMRISGSDLQLGGLILPGRGTISLICPTVPIDVSETLCLGWAIKHGHHASLDLFLPWILHCWLLYWHSGNSTPCRLCGPFLDLLNLSSFLLVLLDVVWGSVATVPCLLWNLWHCHCWCWHHCKTIPLKFSLPEHLLYLRSGFMLCGSCSVMLLSSFSFIAFAVKRREFFLSPCPPSMLLKKNFVVDQV